MEIDEPTFAEMAKILKCNGLALEVFGLPVGMSIRSIKVFQPIIHKFRSKHKCLSIGGRLTLIKVT